MNSVYPFKDHQNVQPEKFNKKRAIFCLEVYSCLTVKVACGIFVEDIYRKVTPL